MNDTTAESKLMNLSIDQLNRLQEKLEHKIAEKKAAIKTASKVPPRSQSDIEKLADLQGLDLSGLMREIAKR